MNTLLFIHIAAAAVLLGLTAVRVVAAARKKPRHKTLDFAAVLAAAATCASGLGLLWQGASLAHMCVSGALVAAAMVGTEVYVRRAASGLRRPV